MIRVTALGGADEIGGSCAVMQAFDAVVVVDCGLRPRAIEHKYPDLERIADVRTPHALVVTHAHADHTGALPAFHRRFPGVPIFATTPTIQITRTMLRDSVAIMERDWEGEVEFTQQDVDALSRVFVPVAFKAPIVIALTEQVRVTARFSWSGHILGAATVALEVLHRPSQRRWRILFSGDVSLFDQPTIPGLDLDAVAGLQPDLFVCEGTYGAAEHKDLALEEVLFVRQVADVLRRGGKVLIPAFAVGRAQNVALVLRHAAANPARVRRLLGDPGFTLPPLRVFVDGLCRTVCEQYHTFREQLGPMAQDGAHTFFDEVVRPVRTAQERARILQDPDPLVVISSSGMLTGGQSVRYAQAFAKDPRSAIFLVGYQDEESAGAALQRLSAARTASMATAADTGAPTEAPRVMLGGESVEVRCEVAQYSMSAHSDAADLERLIEAVAPARVALVHGTPLRLVQLHQRLETTKAARGWVGTVEIAHLNEPLEIGDAGWRLAAAARGDAVDPFADAFDVPMAPPEWALQQLTGRAFLQAFTVAPATPFLTATLTNGVERAYSDADLARLGTVVVPYDAVNPVEVSRLRQSLQGGPPIAGTAAPAPLWSYDRAGREDVHRLALPPAGGLAAHTKALQKYVSEGVLRSLRIVGARDAQWTRVRNLGVAVGDLVLFVDIGREELRLLAGVTTSETAFGFTMLAPGATDPAIAAHQIMARVAAWSPLSGTPGICGAADLRLLEVVGRAIAAFAGEHLAHRDDAVGSAHGALWALVLEGRLSAEAATLGSLLVERAAQGEVEQRWTMPALTELLGGASRAMVQTALGELAGMGVLSVRDEAGGIRLILVPEAVAGLTTRPEAAEALTQLGPVLESLVRQAFASAVAELERVGVLSREGRGVRWLLNPVTRQRLAAGAAHSP